MSDGALFLGLLGPYPLSALVALASGHRGRVTAAASGALALVPPAAALGLATAVLRGATPSWGANELLRIDALSALLAVCVSGIGALAIWLGPGLGGEATAEPEQQRRFHLFAGLFVFTMLLAVSANNVGVMWVALEATTIASAVLIPLHVSKGSVEASWKYLLIGSVGIALALAGTVLAFMDFTALSGESTSALNWTVLVASAPRLHREVLELAFVFLLVGFGTKAGLAPMHTWLPDAHSEAPAPVSALMSGVLLAVALYAVIRWKAVVTAAGGGALADRLLTVLAVLSIAIAALSLVAQRHYKRLLAYSSVEHLGLAALGLALGPAGTFAAVLHLVNHALAKSMLFLAAGRILARYASGEVAQVRGLARAMPLTAALYAGGLLALMGLPPFGPFLSKLALVRAGFAAGRPWLMALVLGLLAVAFVARVLHLQAMLYGEPRSGVARGEPRPAALVPLALCLAALVVLGLVMPAPLQALRDRAVGIASP